MVKKTIAILLVLLPGISKNNIKLTGYNDSLTHNWI